MAADFNVKLFFELTGLGAGFDFQDSFSTTTPTAITHQYRQQNTANTAEAIDLGDVSTVELLIIRSITNDAQIDCDYVSSFDADIELGEGEFACFKPSGTVYLKNETTDEQVTYEYWAIGTL